MWRETVHSQSYVTLFRHSTVLSLPAVLLRKLPNGCSSKAKLLLHACFCFLRGHFRQFRNEFDVTDLNQWVFVLDQWVFVLDQWEFVSDRWVFVFDKWVFVLDQWVLGPVHTYPDIFESATFSFRIRLSSTRIRRIRKEIRKFLNPLSRVD